MEEQNTPDATQETTQPASESELIRAAREEFGKQIDELKTKHTAELAEKDKIIKDLLASDTRRRSDAKSLDDIAERLNARNNFYKFGKE